MKSWLSNPEIELSDSVRIDKWLWAARFFKTRGLAKKAIDGGKVHINGNRAKAARAVQIGDRMEINRHQERFEVVVAELSDRRGPASIAQTLYQETEASVTRRTEESAQRRAFHSSTPRPERRPDKRQRRQLTDLKSKQSD